MSLHHPEVADGSSEAVAAAAGLRFVTDSMPGIQRKLSPRGDGFEYVDPVGTPIRESAELERIRALGIPPAWVEVWICPFPDGHLQATGRDARGRKQYLYHRRWRQARDLDKFAQVAAFGRALPVIRQRVAADLCLSGLSHDRVLALVVRLLELTLIRIGNEDYARKNHSYGLTTLLDQHAEIVGAEIRFSFRGKSGKDHLVSVSDPRLAAIVKGCQDLPGQQLFQYLDGAGQVHDVESGDINAYLQAIMGHDFTAKDFRTWGGTLWAVWELCRLPASSPAEATHNIITAVVNVSQRLGNTAAVCHRSYIHPAVLNAYRDNRLAAFFLPDPALAPGVTGLVLGDYEASLIRFLEATGGSAHRQPAPPADTVGRHPVATGSIDGA